jgi:predicted RNase H-like HicB family nuclease
MNRSNLSETVDNLREATELYLEDSPLEEGRKSLMTTFEVALRARA